MKLKVVNWALIACFLIGIIGSGYLVFHEIFTPNTCPKLLGIPACYLIFACFIVPFFTHLKKGSLGVYFAFTGLAFTIALLASIFQVNGNVECPKTGNNIPMCYYSLALFTSLIVLKLSILKISD